MNLQVFQCLQMSTHCHILLNDGSFYMVTIGVVVVAEEVIQ